MVIRFEHLGEFFIILEPWALRITTSDGDGWHLTDPECPAFIRKRILGKP